MKIILTGGAGFIASHIADRYLEAGHEVVVLDDLSTGRKENLNPKVRFYETDIRNEKEIDLIFRKERPQFVNHHAAKINVRESVERPSSVWETNVIGTSNIATAFAAHRKPGGKFIFASTGGAIYGNPKVIPASEKTPPSPLSPYALSKLFAENIISFFSRQEKFPYLILRYANVYGPRQNPKGEAGVVAIFTDLIQKGHRPVIFGDGTKTRDYVFVEDVARANLLALRKGKNEVVNIGTGKEISDKKIFDLIARTYGYKGKPKLSPFRKGEALRISLKNRHAKEILGWEPKTDLRTGIKKVFLLETAASLLHDPVKDKV